MQQNHCVLVVKLTMFEHTHPHDHVLPSLLRNKLTPAEEIQLLIGPKQLHDIAFNEGYRMGWNECRNH